MVGYAEEYLLQNEKPLHYEMHNITQLKHTKTESHVVMKWLGSNLETAK